MTNRTFRGHSRDTYPNCIMDPFRETCPCATENASAADAPNWPMGTPSALHALSTPSASSPLCDQSEEQKEKTMKKSVESPGDLWDTIGRTSL